MKDVKMKDEKNGRRRISDDWLVAILALVLYLGVGAWLISQDIIFPDSMSRVANGYYVVFSRDPHLAAIGFVWNPLPSLAAIPLLLLSPLIPVLASKAFAGVIVSVDHFGASAPAAELFAEYGFTGDAVAARVRRALA